jgi:hypothetical protein
MWKSLTKMFAPKLARRDYHHRGKQRLRPALEVLEDRTVPTTTLWLDFGDNFPLRSTTVPGTSPPVFTSEQLLDISVEQLRTTLSGPDLSSFGPSDTDTLRFRAFGHEVNFDYNADGSVNAVDAAQLRTAVVSLIERYYAPFDIDVRIAAASDLDDVTNRLAENAGDLTGQNDAYMFVTGIRNLSTTRPIASGLYGLAPVPDIAAGSNTRDDSAIVILNHLFPAGYANQTADTALALTIAHEAGHTFGLKHVINGSAITDTNLLSQSDLMTQFADVGQEQELTFFTRYPLKLVGGVETQNAYNELVADADIGARREHPAYVTGTGAHDRITITRRSDTEATVQVQAFRNANRTGAITVPGTTSTVFTYTIPTTYGILVDAGFGNDEIIVDARIARDIEVRGMAGTDELVVRGQSTMRNHVYEPAVTIDDSLDDTDCYHGVVRGTNLLGPNPVVTFSEFEPDSSVRVQGYVYFTFLTPRDTWDDLTISSPAAGQNRVAGTGIPAGSAIPVAYVPLVTVNVPTLDVATNTLPDEITVSSTAAGSGQLLLATEQGDDTITVERTSVATTIHAGDGHDWINVGTKDVQLDGILAPVTVHGESGTDHLEITDSGDLTAGYTYTMTNTSVVRDGIASIIYDDEVESLRLNASSRHDIVNIRSTSGATPVTINLKAGGSLDTVNIGNTANSLDDIRGEVTILAMSGSDGSVYQFLNINDHGDATPNTYTHWVEYLSGAFYRGRVVRSGAAMISYGGGFSSFVLNAGTGNDTVHVQGTTARAPLTVNAGGGIDIITVGSPTNQLDTIDMSRESLTVNGQDGFNALIVNDQGNSTGQSYGLNGGVVWRGFSRVLRHSDVHRLVLNTSSGDDQINVSGTPALLEATVNAGGGADTLWGGNAVNTFVITGTNSGSFNPFWPAATAFTSVENLLGYIGTDTFAFRPGGSVTGWVDGGTGVATLDYSAYASDVLVNLALGVATGVGGPVSNIDNVIGGSGNDILVGDAGKNHLVGGVGRDLLIGGFGADRLEGGGDDDLLIDGVTIYDEDADMLAWIRSVWSSAGTYQNRVASLMPYLAKGVYLDSSADELWGQAGQDWFWADDLDASWRSDRIAGWEYLRDSLV